MAVAVVSSLRRNKPAASGASVDGPGVVNIPALAEAIANAEGFFVPGSLPYKANNPGAIFENGKLKYFATEDAGWAALYKLLSNAAAGRGMLGSTRTWREFGWMYVNGTRPGEQVIHATDAPDAWVSNVLAYLEVGSGPWDEWKDYVLV